MRGELGDFLADAGAVVGGATALGATLGFIVGSVIHDFAPKADPAEWARKGGVYGGVFGLGALLVER
jgi:hypothetical protein